MSSSLDVTRVVLIRHGETDWNVEGRIQGHTDIGLNGAGRWQAEQLAAALAHEDFSAIYASDLDRAFDTASAVASGRHLTVTADAGLRERGFGVFEGMSFPAIETRWPDQALRWRRRDPDFGPEGGEVLRDFYDRCVAAVHRLASRHAGESIVMVAHGGVLDCLYRAATQMELDSPRTWRIGNASINRLLRAGDVLTLVGWNDDRHLEERLTPAEPGATSSSAGPRPDSG